MFPAQDFQVIGKGFLAFDNMVDIAEKEHTGQVIEDFHQGDIDFKAVLELHKIIIHQTPEVFFVNGLAGQQVGKCDAQIKTGRILDDRGFARAWQPVRREVL